MLTEISSTKKEIKHVLTNDSTNELIDYLKEENRKQTERQRFYVFND